MRLSVGTNFDNQLLNGLAKTDAKVVYGKMSQDIFGGGRPTLALPDVSQNQLIDHINLAHNLGMEFNYLLNTNCMDNTEFQSDVNQKIFSTIEWLDDIGVDWITVSIPYFIGVIKNIAPRIKVSLSTFAYVDTLQKALAFEELGVDEITLPEGLNRNFELLRILRDNLSCDLQLIGTNLCLSGCPYRIYHSNAQSHASQMGHISKGVNLDYCMLSCSAKTLSNPAEFIKIPWIRPEDVGVYEAIGINSIKITERMKKTERLIEIAEAYTKRQYKGKLNRLLNFRIKEDYISPKQDLLEGAEDYNIEYLIKSRELLFRRDIEIDNSELDGFIDYFVKKKTDCRNEQCGKSCRYCYEIAKKAILTDWAEPVKISKEINDFIDKIYSGALFEEKGAEESCYWSEDILKELDEYLMKKPEFVRSSAKKQIMMLAEELARLDNRSEITLNDVIKANYECTPDEFKKDFIAEIQARNIEIDWSMPVIQK